MNSYAKALLAILGLVVLLLFLAPVVALVVVLGCLLGLIGLVVAAWAVVLLAERWIDEGPRGYGYGDALDDALRQFGLTIQAALAR